MLRSLHQILKIIVALFRYSMSFMTRLTTIMYSPPCRYTNAHYDLIYYATKITPRRQICNIRAPPKNRVHIQVSKDSTIFFLYFTQMKIIFHIGSGIWEKSKLDLRMITHTNIYTQIIDPSKASDPGKHYRWVSICVPLRIWLWNNGTPRAKATLE